MEISGDTTIARTGKVVSYKVQYEINGSQGFWTGSVLLRHGKWHQLKGGNLVNVSRSTIAPAVIQCLHAELELLDFDALNAGHS